MVFKRCHHRIADGLDDFPAVSLDDLPEQSVAVVDHEESGGIAVLFKVRGGTLDVRKQHRDVAPQTLEFRSLVKLLGVEIQNARNAVVRNHVPLLISSKSAWL